MWKNGNLQHKPMRLATKRGPVAWVTIAALGCVVLATAALAHADRPPSTPLTKLSHTELQILLSGGARFRPLPIGAGIGATRREYFRASGEYEGCGDRVAVFGTFTLKRDELCVATHGANGCRAVLQSPTGDYFERFGDAPGALRVEITKSQQESCRTVGVNP